MVTGRKGGRERERRKKGKREGEGNQEKEKVLKRKEGIIEGRERGKKTERKRHWILFSVHPTSSMYVLDFSGASVSSSIKRE